MSLDLLSKNTLKGKEAEQVIDNLSDTIIIANILKKQDLLRSDIDLTNKEYEKVIKYMQINTASLLKNLDKDEMASKVETMKEFLLDDIHNHKGTRLESLTNLETNLSKDFSKSKSIDFTKNKADKNNFIVSEILTSNEIKEDLKQRTLELIELGMPVDTIVEKYRTSGVLSNAKDEVCQDRLSLMFETYIDNTLRFDKGLEQLKMPDKLKVAVRNTNIYLNETNDEKNARIIGIIKSFQKAREIDENSAYNVLDSFNNTLANKQNSYLLSEAISDASNPKDFYASRMKDFFNKLEVSLNDIGSHSVQKEFNVGIA